MTEPITITITAEERDELLNALYYSTSMLEHNLTEQELGIANRLLVMLELTAEHEETREPEET